MQEINLKSVNFILDMKLKDKTTKTNHITRRLDNINFKSIIERSLNKKMIDLFDPIILSILKDDYVYSKCMGNIISKENYLDKVKKIDISKLLKTVEENIEYLEPNNNVHKYMLEAYINYQLEKGIFKQRNRSYNASLNNILKPTISLKTLTHAMIKLNAYKLGLYVDPNDFLIMQYYNHMKPKKYALYEYDGFKRIKHLNKEHKKCMSINHYNDLSFNITNSNQVYYEIIKIVNHDLCHLMQKEDKITLNKYPSFDQYKYLKELRILEFDPDFYTKYHDYFELEIQANVYGAKQTIKELKKDHKLNKELIKKYEEYAKKQLLKRCHKSYDLVNKQFDKVIKNKVVKNDNYFNFEYKDDKKRTLVDLIMQKEIYKKMITKDEKLCEKAKSPYLKELKVFREHKLDKSFINNIMFEQIIRLTLPKFEITCMLLNHNQILSIKEALTAGKFNYMNNMDMITEINVTDKNYLDYNKDILSKIDDMNIIVEKNLNKENNKRR